MDPRLRLLLSSALMLFLELALIRWTAANIVHLGYFSNFVLLGSLLGVGVGFLSRDMISVGGTVRLGDRCLGRNHANSGAPRRPLGAQVRGNRSLVIGVRHGNSLVG
jgi:hypothetical protein